MTEAFICELADSVIFECKGHALYAEKGRDIVCAGISAICIAVTEMLSTMEQEGETEFLSFHMADGELSFEVALPDDLISRTRLLTVMNTARAGFEKIGKLYPEHFSPA